MSSHLLCFVLHHNAKWLKDKLTFIKILHTCHGLKEINRRKLIVDASNTRRGSCEHRSTLCMIKNPHFSFFPSLFSPSSLLYPSCLIFSTSKHLLSGSVASPSMLSPASRAQRNSRIFFFFFALSPHSSLSFSSHMTPLSFTHSHSVRVHTCVCIRCTMLRASSCEKWQLQRERDGERMRHGTLRCLWPCTYQECANTLKTHFDIMNRVWYISMTDIFSFTFRFPYRRIRWMKLQYRNAKDILEVV